MMEKDVKNKCFKCGGEFTRRDSLRRHLKTHDRPKLICCGKTFKRGDFYKAHKVKYHGPDILVLSPSKKQCRVSVNQGASTSRDIVNQVVTSVLGKVNNNVQNSEISRLQIVIDFNFTPAVQEMKSGNDDLDVYTRAPIVSYTSLELRKPYKVVSYNQDEDNVSDSCFPFITSTATAKLLS